jgi:CheY-like chemotaxis protein
MTTVLIVEDETNIRKLAKANLSARGYNVIEAPNATEGLRQLQDGSPAILLLDIKLPDMSGWDLLSIVAQDPKIASIPVIVMTASAVNDNIVMTGRANVVRVLSKPLDIYKLIDAVKETTEKL